MSVKLLTQHHLEVRSLKGGCKGFSKSALVEMPHCWKSHVVAQIDLTLHETDQLAEISSLLLHAIFY